MRPVASTPPPTLLRLLRARRFRVSSRLTNGLATLQKLHARYDDGTVAALTEKRVEQSWKKQISEAP
jgi:hypothetical protein